MDAAFEILLPDGSDLSPFKFDTPVFEWDGISYPQGAPESQFGSMFKLKVLDKYYFDYIKSKLPGDLKNIKWLPIAVLGEDLDAYNAQLFGLGTEEDGFSLRYLLKDFLDKKTNWIVIFQPQYDGFSEVKKGNINDVLTMLEFSIRTSRKGFMIYHTNLSPSLKQD